MATHGLTIAKASAEDFERVRSLLAPMDALFDNRFFGQSDECWMDWDDDDEDKVELLSIQNEIARNEDCLRSDVDNRLVVYEFIRRRFLRANCGNWNRVMIAAETLIDTFCDPNVDHLAWSPELARVAEDIMLGE